MKFIESYMGKSQLREALSSKGFVRTVLMLLTATKIHLNDALGLPVYMLKFRNLGYLPTQPTFPQLPEGGLPVSN
jgi:hypothetical protein